MDEKTANLLTQYDLAVYRAGRVKGAWLLETDRGLKHLGICSYSEGKIKFEQKVKQFVVDGGFATVDLLVPNREEGFLVQGAYNEQFAMRNWFQGEECNAKCREQVLGAVAVLARLHRCLERFPITEEEREFCLQTSLTESFMRRNKELRRVRTYIRSKKQKNYFEQNFLAQFDAQFAQAVQALEQLSETEYEPYYKDCVARGCMLHGNYTHHSILMLPGDEMAVIGFDKAVNGIQIQDFYQIFRKVMEKWDWDVSLGDDMLTTYQRVRPIPEKERQFLMLMLSYPEKFWKVANQYYNNRKSWIPEKNMQKLLQTMNQAEKKTESIRQLFT